MYAPLGYSSFPANSIDITIIAAISMYVIVLTYMKHCDSIPHYLC